MLTRLTDAAGKILSVKTVLEKHWKCNPHRNDKGPSHCCGKDETARGVTTKAHSHITACMGPLTIKSPGLNSFLTNKLAMRTISIRRQKG